MPKQALLIRGAQAIVTCDEQDTVHCDADVLVVGAEIQAIGKNLPSDGAQIIDAAGKVVYPGLINTHHHFFQSFVRNLVAIDYPSMHVLDWVESIYQIFRFLTSDAIYYASYVAMTDLLKHGCTCAFDHQYCFPRAAGGQIVDRQMDAAKSLGIRFHAGRGANTLPRTEGSSIPDEMLESTEEFLRDCERLVAAYHQTQKFGMQRVVIAPCQPINCYRETFAETVSLARSLGVSMHTHLGEGENEGMLARWGMRTLDWCEELGFAGSDVWYAHGWELDSGEYQRMGGDGTGLSHCPAPAVLGGFDIIDVQELDKHKVNISLGCDGSATNDSSNLLDSLRLAYLMQAQSAKRRGSYPTPYRMLKMATAGGAAVLGREDLGILTPGRAADLFMIDATKLELVGAMHDPKSVLAKTGLTETVWLTMVNGRVVFHKGELTGVDEEAVRARALEVFEKDVVSRHDVFNRS